MEERGADIGRGATRGNANEKIARAYSCGGEIGAGSVGSVFGALLRPRECGVAARDDSLYEFRRDTESRRTPV